MSREQKPPADRRRTDRPPVPEGGRRILALWSVPRSRSTAFFRMMLERGDVTAVHEPFSTLAECGEAEIQGRRVTSAPEAIQRLRELSRERLVFFKDTTDERYPAVLTDSRFLATEVRSTFLIRHPAETIPSYYSVNPQVRPSQIGFGHLRELFHAVEAAGDPRPVVLDAEDLVSSPEAIIKRYCLAIGIPYLPHALSWTAGSRPEWRATERWHRDVSRTNGFEPRTPGHGVRLSDAAQLERYLVEHLPTYQQLRRRRLRP